MTDVHHSVNPIGEDCRSTIESEAAVSASATAAIQGRKMPADTRHGLPHIGEKVQITELQVSSITYSSAKTENFIVVHETNEQILELAKKDALYTGNEGHSDIECDENDLHHDSAIEEDK
eukprot:15330779-Ditylum_brightwellii.AAC.1